MFSRQQIIEKIGETGFDPGEYWVVAGAAMVLHGVKEYTNDIDLGCSKIMADRLRKMGCRVQVLEDGERRIWYDADIELFENWKEGNIEISDSIPVFSLEGVIAIKE